LFTEESRQNIVVGGRAFGKRQRMWKSKLHMTDRAEGRARFIDQKGGAQGQIFAEAGQPSA
jgi:hypothetical protein